MERYYIALKELGAKNELLLKILTEYEPNFISDLFKENSDIFLTHLEWIPYKTIFDNREKIRTALAKADEILRANIEQGIHTALYSTLHYPKNLMKMNNPPAVIYYKGTNPNEGFEKSIASIGTRKPTHFGFNAINYLIPQWVNEGFAIISGLAEGVDRLSHIACLAENGKTIAVLAHGLDEVYPLTNKKLAEQILLCGGTLLSEYPVKTVPTKFRFVRRNRLIVGLSKVIVVMECEEKSGSMRSVEFAQKQHLPIFFPYPGEQPSIDKSGLQFLLNNNIGHMIKDGTDYEKVVFAAGYKLEKPRMKNSYIKEQYLRALLIGIENENIIRIVLEKIGLKYTSDCSCIISLNNYLLDYIKNSNFSIESILNILIDTILSLNFAKKES